MQCASKTLYIEPILRLKYSEEAITNWVKYFIYIEVLKFRQPETKFIFLFDVSCRQEVDGQR